MAFVEPLDIGAIPELNDIFDRHRDRYGFIPNSYLSLARNPQFLRAFVEVGRAGLWNGKIDQVDRYLVAAVASAEGGCLYCLGHLGVGIESEGGSPEMLRAALTELDTTPLISERQRVAFEFARDIASIPNRVGPYHFRRMREWFDEEEIIEVAFVAAHFGFLSRINAMLGSTIETEASRWAEQHLAQIGWKPGVHAADGDGKGADLRLDKPAIPDERGERPAPIARDKLPELEETFAYYDERTYVPNSILVLARRPDLVTRMTDLWASFRETTTIPSDLAFMVSWISSYATGCQYCQAHTSLHAFNNGASEAKVEALWEFESSSLFTEAERAALRLAVAGASQPSGVTQQIVDDVRDHFTERQVIDLMIQIALFGFLNRWNDTFATPLEEGPLQFATAHLKDSGWDGGAHVPGDDVEVGR